MIASKRYKPVVIASVMIILLIFSCIVGIFSAKGENAYADVSFTANWLADIDGTRVFSLKIPESENSENNPYIIATADDLALLSLKVNSGSNYGGVYFEQTQSIDLDGKYFIPIGCKSTTPFSGTYNGGGFTVSNLYVDPVNDLYEGNDVGNYSGLFGCIKKPGVTNVTSKIKNVKIASGIVRGYRCVGAILGASVGNSGGEILENCENHADVDGYEKLDDTNNASRFIGGIAGEFKGDLLSGCKNYGTVNGASYIGGIVGNSISKVFGCENYGALTALLTDGNNDSVECVGGLIGRMENSNSSLKKSFNTAAVLGNDGAISVGGAVGFVSDLAIVENCFNTGAVFGSNKVGGAVGNGQAIIRSCYNSAEITADGAKGVEICLGGVIGYNSGNVIDTYSTGKLTVTTLGEAKFIGGVVGKDETTSSTQYSYYNNSFYPVSGGIGKDVGGIESAESYDSAEKRAKGLNIYKMIGFNNTEMLFNSVDAWGYVEVQKDVGFTPILKEVFSEVFAETPDYSKLAISGVNQPLFDSIDSPSGLPFGSSTNPYVINNKEQLGWFYYNMNSNLKEKSTYENCFLELGYDITVTGTVKPLGNAETPFMGTFDGKDHVIDDLYILETGSDNVGFFGYVKNGAVKNLTFTDFKIYGKDNVGVLVGTADNAEIVNITLTSANSINGENNVGGVAGISINSDICNVIAENYVVYGNNLLGGIVGSASSTTDNSILNIEVKYLTLHSIISDGEKIGGVAGNSDKMTYNNIIVGVQINGASYLGGIVGFAENIDISLALVGNGSSVVGTGSCVGGMVGRHTSGHYSTLMVYDATLSAASSAGGLFGEGSTSTYLEDVGTNLPINATGDYVGGLGGRIYGEGGSSLTLLRSYSISVLNGNGYVGGLIGSANSVNGSVTQCYFSGSVASNRNAATVYSLVGGNVDNITFTKAFYNSDTISLQTVNNAGEGKCLLDMTANGLKNQLTEGGSAGAWYFKGNESIHGYYPQSTVLFEIEYNDYSTKICTENYFNAGDGNASNPYTLSTELQLVVMQGLIDREYSTYGSKSYELTAHITLTKEFVPVASLLQPFNGSFNGAYYEIRNFKINRPDEDYVGFFRCIGDTGSVLMMAIQTDTTHESTVTGRDYVGGIVGKSTGSISYSYNRAYITGRSNVGGVAGYADNLVYSFNTGTVSGETTVGGLVGTSAEGGIVESGYNSGYVIMSGSDYAGGLIGINGGGVNYCYNSGGVYCSNANAYVGGLIGKTSRLTTSTINNCYVVGFFEGTIPEARIGAVLGYSELNSNNTLQYTYYNTEQAVILKSITNLRCVADGAENVYDHLSVKGFLTYSMVGNLALTAQTMNFNFAYYVSNEDQSQDADYSPQLKYFSELSLGESSDAVGGKVGNAVSLANIIQLSKESARLGLFGRNSSSIDVWGGENNPYLISTPEHLLILQKNVELGFSYEGYFFKLTDDLDMAGRTFAPIGKYCLSLPENSLSFNGSFDGAGYSISNLTINATAADYSAGLFGYLTATAEVKNLRLDENCSITGMTTVGGVAGYSYARLYRIFSSASVSGISDVGGLVGNQRGNIIDSCLCDGIVTASAGGTEAAGIVKLFNSGELNPALNAEIYNSWYVATMQYYDNVDISYDHSSKRGSILYLDTQGKHSVDVYADFSAAEDGAFINFKITPAAGYGYSVRYFPSEEEVNLGGIDPSARYDTLENPAVKNGSEVKWYVRFTKEVFLKNVAKVGGDATFGVTVKGTEGHSYSVGEGTYSHVLGNYYYRQEVTVTVSISDGYYAVLDESRYSYRNDANNNLQAVFTMPDADFEYSITLNGFCEATANGATGVTPLNVVEGEGTPISVGNYTYDVGTGVYSFVYDQIEKGFTAAIAKDGGYFLNEIKYVYEGSIVRNPTRAGTYTLQILLRDSLNIGGNVYIGTKSIRFTIVKVRLGIDDDTVVKVKEYDGKSVSEVVISSNAIVGVISGDSITLTATMTFLTPAIGENKQVTLSFSSGNLSGIDAINYDIPEAVTIADGAITKRTAKVLINDSALTSPYTGTAPYISAASVEGLLITDSNYRFQYDFSFCDENGTPVSSSNPKGTVGYYRVFIDYATVEGLDNYNIDIDSNLYDDVSGHYYKIFRITPKIITSMTFSGYENLVYTGYDLLPNIKARYAKDEYTQADATLELYYGNSTVTKCIDAGDYFVIATIDDVNFDVRGEISQTFTVSKIGATVPFILSATYVDEDSSVKNVGERIDYGVSEITMQTVGGNGDGEVSYELISGSAAVVGNRLLINGTGVVSVRAKKAESKNYFRINSEPLTFNVIKAVLRAELSDVYMTYGDELVVEIVYNGYKRGESGADDVAGLIPPEMILPTTELNARAEGYPISLRDNGYSDGYVIDVTGAAANVYVMRRDVVVRAVAGSKIYGVLNERALEYQVSESGVTLNGSLKRAFGENAGEYLIAQNTLTNENNPNYNIHYSPAYFSIKTKELRVSVPSLTKVYGVPDPTPNFVIDVQTLAFSDNESVLSGSITRTAGEKVGKYSYSANASAGNNYFVNLFSVGTLTIEKAIPDIRDVKASKLNYGETLAYSEITAETDVEGVFNWEQPTIKPSFIDSNLTQYSAIFKPNDFENYAEVTLDLSVAVVPIDAMVSFIGMTDVFYDGERKDNFTVRFNNVVADDAIAFSLKYSSDRVINAGLYTVTVEIFDNNYTLAEGTESLSFRIHKSELTVKYRGATIMQGEDYVPEFSYTGFKGKDDESVLKNPPELENIPEAPGTYELMPTGVVADNYVIKYLKGTLKINRSVVVTDVATINGVISSDTNIKVNVLNKSDVSFKNMQKTTQKIFKEDEEHKGWVLDTYVSFAFSEMPSESVTVNLALTSDMTADSVFVLYKRDGTVTLLTDYTVKDGELVFSGKDISGVGTLREPNFWEKYKNTIIYSGIAVIILVIVLIIVIISRRVRKKKDAKFPKYE